MLHLEEEIDHITRCPECGKVIAFGRTDRRFCNDRCKNRFHNRSRYPSREAEVKRVLRILDGNRDVLDKLMKLGIKSLDRLSLIHLGFNMNYFTSLHKQGCHWVYSCMDIRYELTPTRIRNIAFLWEGADSQ